MKRREFIALLGGVAVAWPLVARAQQRDRLRRIAVVMQYLETDPQGQLRATAFREGLEKAGWVSGRNIRVDYLWGVMDSEWTGGITEHLRQRVPDVIAINSSIGLRAIESAAPGVPIVFIAVSEPVAQGFVASLARPGGNITGFALFEFAIGAKWLELLKQIAPSVTRVAVIYDPATPNATGFLPMIEAAGRSFGVDVFAYSVRDTAETERIITTFAAEPNGGLIPVASALMGNQRDFIISLAHRYRLPNVFAFRYYPANGGLASYGVDPINLYKRAASYVDRILKGEKPADLPVQMANKYELVINLKTAKALRP